MVIFNSYVHVYQAGYPPFIVDFMGDFVGYKWEKNGKSPTYIVDSRIWRTTCHSITREGTFIGGIKTYYLLLVGGDWNIGEMYGIMMVNDS